MENKERRIKNENPRSLRAQFVHLSYCQLTSAVLFAQSTFDGTWRVNLQNTEYLGKENFSLQNGVCRCSSCVPMINVKADGQDQKVSGSPYFDMINVRVVDDRTIESVSKKGGKLTGTSKVTASQDGRTLTTEFSYVTEKRSKRNEKVHVGATRRRQRGSS